MQVNNCLDETFIKAWGKHKNGFIKLIYNSGSYAEVVNEKDGSKFNSRIVLIRCKDGDLNLEKYANENGFTKVQ